MDKFTLLDYTDNLLKKAEKPMYVITFLAQATPVTRFWQDIALKEACESSGFENDYWMKRTVKEKARMIQSLTRPCWEHYGLKEKMLGLDPAPASRKVLDEALRAWGDEGGERNKEKGDALHDIYRKLESNRSDLYHLEAYADLALRLFTEGFGENTTLENIMKQNGASEQMMVMSTLCLNADALPRSMKNRFCYPNTEVI